MEQAIGQKIADYLIKPVNPSQILMCLKKHVHQQAIVSEQVQQNYRQEWGDISYMIDTASTIEEWQAIERTLSKWDIELENSAMRSLIEDQRTQANVAFAKWIAKNYEGWFSGERPVMSHDLMKHAVFPLLDKGEKVLYCPHRRAIYLYPADGYAICPQCYFLRSLAAADSGDVPESLGGRRR